MINPLCESKKRKARAESRKRTILRYGALVVVNRSSLVDLLLRRGTNETVSILSVGTEGEWTDRNDVYNDLQKYRS